MKVGSCVHDPLKYGVCLVMFIVASVCILVVHLFVCGVSSVHVAVLLQRGWQLWFDWC